MSHLLAFKWSRKFFYLFVMFTICSACSRASIETSIQTGIPQPNTSSPEAPSQPIAISNPAATLTPAPCNGSNCQNSTIASESRVPAFSHVILILLENHEYSAVVGNTKSMPNFNRWIGQNTLLTDYYAVSHPSLPNYIALLGGETFGIHRDCTNCFINAPSLPDEIENSGRTWKYYAENMPAPCALGHAKNLYWQVINPFVYFDSIRLNTDRCDQNVVPLNRLNQDLSQDKLPDFVFITPNLCDSAHSCGLDVTDRWLANMIGKLENSSSYDSNTLIVITFDEGASKASCCGLGNRAGGHVATLLISPLIKTGFMDDTPYSHYSLLKTIESSWNLGLLGLTANAQTNVILAPWIK